MDPTTGGGPNYWHGTSGDDIAKATDKSAKNIYVKLEQNSKTGKWEGEIKKTNSPNWLLFKHAIVSFFSNLTTSKVQYYHGQTALQKIKDRKILKIDFKDQKQIKNIEILRSDFFGKKVQFSEWSENILPNATANETAGKIETPKTKPKEPTSELEAPIRQNAWKAGEKTKINPPQPKITEQENKLLHKLADAMEEFGLEDGKKEMSPADIEHVFKDEEPAKAAEKPVEEPKIPKMKEEASPELLKKFEQEKQQAAAGPKKPVEDEWEDIPLEKEILPHREKEFGDDAMKAAPTFIAASPDKAKAVDRLTKMTNEFISRHVKSNPIKENSLLMKALPDEIKNTPNRNMKMNIYRYGQDGKYELQLTESDKPKPQPPVKQPGTKNYSESFYSAMVWNLDGKLYLGSAERYDAFFNGKPILTDQYRSEELRLKELAKQV